ncbi:dirigent protein 23-like [Populus alba x Populus x berolinensis]|nr:dirigent protein 23-like [Populus alba x Populus x berolinensis]
MHDVISGPNPTAVRVAGPPNATAVMFGSIYMMDNPLTVTPDPNSTVVGRAQGIYGMSSQNEFSLLMSLTVGFISGRNPIMSEVREMPVVGGTGIFRLARGYCLAKTHSTVGFDAIIGYNVTLLHY